MMLEEEIKRTVENLHNHLKAINDDYDEHDGFACPQQVDDIKDIAIALEKFSRYCAMVK